MRPLLLATCAFVGCMLHAPLWAQPAEWGEVPRPHLEMETFSADSNASAVILSDVGSVGFRRTGRLRYKRHRRIKILSEGGYDWGTVELPYRAENRMERIRGIKGQTFTLSEDGEVVRHELDGDDIFEEDVDGTFEQKRFTLPALEPGAVIEYRYEVEKRSPVLMPEWFFQTSEPTLWSEYEVEIPDHIRYVRLTKGAPDFHVEENKNTYGPLGASQHYRWVMRDVPALREEPFMTTLDDYRMSVALQLRQYRTARGRVENFMTSWDDLAEDLMGRSDFGKQLNKGGDVQTRAELVVGTEEDAHAKMKAIYDYVRTKVEWDGMNGVVPDRDVDEVLEVQSGSSPGIALLLTAMLRHVGLEAHPVLISTRKHGRLQPVYPYLRQFNGVLVYVELDDASYLLDATDPLRPYNLLPKRVLNGEGWMVTEEGGEWLNITPAPYRRWANVAGTLTGDGAIEGEMRIVDHAYSALQRRRALEEKGEQAFVRDVLLEALEDVDVESHEINEAMALEEPLTSLVTFQAPAYAQAAGDFLYLNATLIEREKENPLRAPTRTFPIDFAYPRDVRYMLALQLPEGFSVQEAPEDVQVQLPDEGGVFQRLVQVNGEMLTLRTHLVIADTQFEPAQYEALREFYERVVAAQAEQIVLRRTNDETEAAEEMPAGGQER